MYEFDPLSNAAPPVDAAYQSIVSPLPGVAEIVTVPVPHLAASVPGGEAGNELMEAITAILAEDTQPVVVFLASA